LFPDAVFYIIAQLAGGIKCAFAPFSTDLELNLKEGCGTIWVERFLDFIGKAGNRCAYASYFCERVRLLLNIVLLEPEIPMNTGNIARTCAATGSRLHLIRPLGFDISDRAVKRAGLDYWHLVDLAVYDNLDAFFAANPNPDLWLATTKAPRPYTEAEFRDGCFLFFGKETKGLPAFFRNRYRDRCIRLPMRREARSLNLANSVAVIAYEALRQTGFSGLLETGEMKNDMEWNRTMEKGS